MDNLYVQYGCGLSAPIGWLNFDASLTLRFERIPVVGHLYTKNASRFPENVRYGDIVSGLPIKADSCSGIYCSHVLEHLALEETDQALANTFRYLKKGGTFRLVLPDLRQIVCEYLASDSVAAAHRFMESASLGRKQRRRGPIGYIKEWLGNSAHLWMWDEKAITERLHQHGFKSIRRCSFGDSADLKFKEVEDEGRFAGCLAMESKK
jgi:predicted SAM-dependent methyltransferase